jgi:hypothetical protein
MDLVERMNATLEEVPFDAAGVDSDPARVALPALLDLLPKLPEDTGMLSFTGSMVLMRAVLRLLKRIPVEDSREDIVRSAFSDTKSLSARFLLLRTVGHREDIGADLVSEEVEKELEEQLRDELVALSAEKFANETRTVRLADFMAEAVEAKEALEALVEDDRVMLSLFVGSVGVTHSRAIGAAAVQVTKMLAWDQLVKYVGEERLIRRTADLFAKATEGDFELSDEEREALGLAADYATGNRPESSFERIMRIQYGSGNEPVPEDRAADPGETAAMIDAGAEGGEDRGA